jgi:cyclopropane fatty-acyl-phospholipid synthase-like methyltransferase
MSHHPSDFRRERTTPWMVARETLATARLMLSPRRDRAAAVYDILAAHNNLGRDTLYLNMGYWRDAATYDEACEALALLLAERAGFERGDRVLDAGFGYGDQDLLWAGRFGVSIAGFNVNAAQVEVARRRVKSAGLGEQISLFARSAIDTGLDDGWADRVVALESAFHFPERVHFFAEAARVLRRGGAIALADLVVKQDASRRVVDRVGRAVAGRFWQIPRENLVSAATYRRQLEEAGFTEVVVEDVSDHVFAPFGAYARRRQGEPDVAARANPLLRAVWRAPSATRAFDYVIATGIRG